MINLKKIIFGIALITGSFISFYIPEDNQILVSLLVSVLLYLSYNSLKKVKLQH